MKARIAYQKRDFTWRLNTCNRKPKPSSYGYERPSYGRKKNVSRAVGRRWALFKLVIWAVFNMGLELLFSTWGSSCRPSQLNCEDPR